MKFVFKFEEVSDYSNSLIVNVYYGEDSPRKGISVNLIMGMRRKIKMMFLKLGLITRMDQPIHFTLSKDKPENELGNLVVKSYFIKDHLGVPLYTNPTDPDDVFEFCKDGLIEVFGEVPREIYMTIGKIDKK